MDMLTTQDQLLIRMDNYDAEAIIEAILMAVESMQSRRMDLEYTPSSGERKRLAKAESVLLRLANTMNHAKEDMPWSRQFAAGAINAIFGDYCHQREELEASDVIHKHESGVCGVNIMYAYPNYVMKYISRKQLKEANDPTS